MSSRRRFLRIVGGGVVLAAGGIGAFLGTREPARALAPWTSAGRTDDPRLDALSWALLAPNPHNLQPWHVALDGSDAFTLYAEPGRRLPQTDPFDRQLTVGLGCFMELARQAAAQAGYRLEVEPFPEGEPQPNLDGRPIVHARLVSGGKPDPLFGAVLERRSCKEPFEAERIPQTSTLAGLGEVVTDGVAFGSTNQPTEVTALQQLGWEAHQVEMATPRTLMESVDLMRFGKTEIEANPDGIDLGGAFLESLQAVGLMDRAQLADPASEAFRQGMVMYEQMFANTPAFLWLTTPGNTRVEQLAAGASWVRVNLATTQAGLALHPVSQTLQEYPEMSDIYRQVHETLGATGDATVQMLGRVGYGPTQPPSPRWPLEARLRQA